MVGTGVRPDRAPARRDPGGRAGRVRRARGGLGRLRGGRVRRGGDRARRQRLRARQRAADRALSADRGQPDGHRAAAASAGLDGPRPGSRGRAAAGRRPGVHRGLRPARRQRHGAVPGSVRRAGRRLRAAPRAGRGGRRARPAGAAGRLPGLPGQRIVRERGRQDDLVRDLAGGGQPGQHGGGGGGARHPRGGRPRRRRRPGPRPTASPGRPRSPTMSPSCPTTTCVP